jgi:DNA polymerase-3 subunit delta'
MSLAEIRHQPSAQRCLQTALGGPRAPHAYIFHGPEGVGKEMLARAFARVLLCGRPAKRAADSEEAYFAAGDAIVDACGECEDCVLMSAGSHPDFHLIHRELIEFHPDPRVRGRKALDLGVDVIREFMIAAAGSRPVRGRAKVYVVREAERMNVAAQNALLKTLEEPPPDTYIVLVTNSVARLLPTTRSRAQLVPFGPLPPEFVRERLLASEHDLTEAEARLLATVSEGRLGPALESAANALHKVKKSLVAETAALEPGRAVSWAKHVEEAGNQLGETMSATRSEASQTYLKRRALGELLSALAYAFDDVLRLHLGAGEVRAHADQEDLIRKMSGRLDAGRAARAVQSFAEAESNLNRNVNVALTLEGLGAELADLLQPAPTGVRPR